MGEYMQRNAKQAVRRATAAEKDLALATERIKTLEQGLEDAAAPRSAGRARRAASGASRPGARAIRVEHTSLSSLSDPWWFFS